MKAAFYAPMKHPDHPVASGDRTMARGVLAALNAAGIAATTVSSLQSREGKGDPARQAALITQAKAEAARIVAQSANASWDVWITYHSYYKAPDLLGPIVTQALGIPYILIEATRARKRLTGPWAAFAHAAENAADAADAVLYMTTRDAEALHAYAPKSQIIKRLNPFLAQDRLPPVTHYDGAILSVGMLRSGDKLASYHLIAETLAQLGHQDWRLNIAGDGPARAQVERLMAPFGTQVQFLGALDDATMQQAYQRSSILLWPGANEAFGMTYLEAQAAGLAIVAQDRPGVRDVLSPTSVYPTPDAGTKALAQILDTLLTDTCKTKSLGQSGRSHIANHHLLKSAAKTLTDTLCEVRA
ncbi:MAG: glycosyltransferase family 4 protein [Roseobacter sp.]